MACFQPNGLSTTEANPAFSRERLNSHCRECNVPLFQRILASKCSCCLVRQREKSLARTAQRRANERSEGTVLQDLESCRCRCNSCPATIEPKQDTERNHCRQLIDSIKRDWITFSKIQNYLVDWIDAQTNRFVHRLNNCCISVIRRQHHWTTTTIAFKHRTNIFIYWLVGLFRWVNYFWFPCQCVCVCFYWE